ncbi:YbaB/EbfC family nucleoid-associated protein [Actinoplanes aureus]|uniref:YbaB/EbfC family nucleoid-associated protein n=1 Tax=Actinoplanes aureus TaxID=2792083 RepID=A0A931G293_9ACTN|nr:YbaB/EbfC family nucleoid-associated protein [Actinoplanes aureus]MBG0563069.1 YbaB/EbfC family nucleoid-associated protein [Actinoplanes aureus]
MFDGRELYEAERWIDNWQIAIEARAGRARELSSRLAQPTRTARSPDGMVTVTVGGTGDLTGLELGEGIRRRPAATTARDILATLDAARAALTEAVAVETKATIGADSATGRAVIEAYRAEDRRD